MSITKITETCECVSNALKSLVTKETYIKTVNYDMKVQLELAKRFNFNIGALADKRILMVGAGTLGNEVAKNLAFSGVSNITIIDLDKYEYWNLPRSPMITEVDVGRPKALALAERLAERSPFPIRVTGIDADVTMLGWGFFKDYDLIISPVDSLGIRYYVDRGCKLYHKTHITLATGLFKYPYEHMVGDVIVSPADSEVCYACTENGGAQEIRKRIHCGDGYSAETQPQVMGFSSTIAGIASSIAINVLLGRFQTNSQDAIACSRQQWKYSLAEVGMIANEVEAYNLRALRYSKPVGSCSFHSGSDILKSGEVVWHFNKQGAEQAMGNKPIPTVKITHKMSPAELLKILDQELNDNHSSEYLLDLEGWSMLFYSVYKTKSRFIPEEVHSDSGTILIDRYLNVGDLVNKLPREHIYRIAKDGDCDKAQLIKLVICNE